MYALRGKPQNTEEDEEFGDTIYSGLIRALGLNQGEQFNIEADLRYGHVMLLTNQVVYAQLSNFFSYFFPSCSWFSLSSLPQLFRIQMDSILRD